MIGETDDCHVYVYCDMLCLLLGINLCQINLVYIVACQRGGVSNKPPGQRQDTIIKLDNYLDIKI